MSDHKTAVYTGHSGLKQLVVGLAWSGNGDHSDFQSSVDYNGWTLAKIQAKWLHGCINCSWSDII